MKNILRNVFDVSLFVVGIILISMLVTLFIRTVFAGPKYLKYDDRKDPTVNSYRSVRDRQSRSEFPESTQKKMNQLKSGRFGTYAEKEQMVGDPEAPTIPPVYIDGPNIIQEGSPTTFTLKTDYPYKSYGIQGIWNFETPVNTNLTLDILDTDKLREWTDQSSKTDFKIAEPSNEIKWTKEFSIAYFGERWSSTDNQATNWADDKIQTEYAGEDSDRVLIKDLDGDAFVSGNFTFDGSGSFELKAYPLVAGLDYSIPVSKWVTINPLECRRIYTWFDGFGTYEPCLDKNISECDDECSYSNKWCEWDQTWTVHSPTISNGNLVLWQETSFNHNNDQQPHQLIPKVRFLGCDRTSWTMLIQFADTNLDLCEGFAWYHQFGFTVFVYEWTGSAWSRLNINTIAMHGFCNVHGSSGPEDHSYGFAVTDHQGTFCSESGDPQYDSDNCFEVGCGDGAVDDSHNVLFKVKRDGDTMYAWVPDDTGFPAKNPDCSDPGDYIWRSFETLSSSTADIRIVLDVEFWAEIDTGGPYEAEWHIDYISFTN